MDPLKELEQIEKLTAAAHGTLDVIKQQGDRIAAIERTLVEMITLFPPPYSEQIMDAYSERLAEVLKKGEDGVDGSEKTS